MNTMLIISIITLVCWSGGVYFMVTCGDSARRLAFGALLLLVPFALV